MTDVEKILRSSLSEMQGNLFRMSGQKGWDSETFIKVFMRSKIAEGLDCEFDFMHWAGKEYIMERMQEEYPEGFTRGGEVYSDETLYWTGYLYRFWHFQTGESSKEIYRQADAKTMNITYLGYHTFSPEMAIDRLKEAKKAKKKTRDR